MARLLQKPEVVPAAQSAGDVANAGLPGAGASDIGSLLRKGAGFDPQSSCRGTGLRGATHEWSKAAGWPDNSPKKRVEGATALTQQWLEVGGLSNAMFQLIGTDSTAKDLIVVLTVRGDGDKRALIGKSRAADIAINAVLPAIHARLFSGQATGMSVRDGSRCIVSPQSQQRIRSLVRWSV